MASASASPQASSSRASAGEILEEAVRVGEDELKRSSTGLAFSGLAAGLSMGLSALGSAALAAAVGGAHAALAGDLLYPLGFIAVIVGRAQLFTENTLFPVILVLERRRHLRNTARLWTVVFAANLLGTLLFALLAVTASATGPEVMRALGELGKTAASGSELHLFWAGVAGGWIIALVAWLISATRFTIAQVTLIWFLTFAIAVAHLAHCIAGSAEILSAVLAGTVSVGHYLHWLWPVTLGNTLGGVVIVALLNYAQVRGSGRDSDRSGSSLEEVEDKHIAPARTRSRPSRSAADR